MKNLFLVVEADESERTDIEAMVTSLGHLAIGVATPADAKKILTEIAFDVVIAPYANTLMQTLQRVLPRAKFIVLSAGNEAALEGRGFDSFIQKPCTFVSLRNAISG